MINRLPKNHPQWEQHPFTTSTHLHGSASLPQHDGYADDVTYPGFYRDYWYPNVQEARTLWYHDHGVHHTAQSAYGGLAAQYHLHDLPKGQEADLPRGNFDIPLTIHDAMFSADGRLAHDDNNFSGLWGDVILVDGKPWPFMNVQPRVYRFRVLNASIARSSRLHLSDNSEFAIVGTDGGLSPRCACVSTGTPVPSATSCSSTSRGTPARGSSCSTGATPTTRTGTTPARSCSSASGPPSRTRSGTR